MTTGGGAVGSRVPHDLPGGGLIGSALQVHASLQGPNGGQYGVLLEQRRRRSLQRARELPPHLRNVRYEETTSPTHQLPNTNHQPLPNGPTSHDQRCPLFPRPSHLSTLVPAPLYIYAQFHIPSSLIPFPIHLTLRMLRILRPCPGRRVVRRPCTTRSATRPTSRFLAASAP